MRRMKIVFIIALLFLFSCAGSPGKDGTNGVDVTTDSTSGFNSLITITDEASGENCETGGKRIDTGLDDGDGTENDGILQESEIDFSEYVCNGLDGTNGENGSNGDNGQNGADSTADTVDASGDNYIKLSSIAEKGPCGKGSAVLAFPLHLGFDQTGAHYLGSTKTDLGYWEVPAQISENRTQVDFEGLCYNERYGTTEIQKLNAIVETGSADRNINPLTTISVDVIRWVYENQAVEDEDQAVIDAELLVSNVFGFGQMSPFSSITLNDGDLNAAKLALASAAILQARSNQTDFMTEIAEAIKNENTEAVEIELAENIEVMPITVIVDNLRSKYESLGYTWIYPPMHTVAGFPDYYADLIERVPVEQGSFNLDDSAGCSFDMNTYNMFAIPHIFESWIETSKYLALNLAGGDISVWTRIFNGYDRPGAKIIEIEELREILLEGNLIYNGLLGDHSLSAGTDYYIVISNDTGWALSTGCDGDLLPFGRKLASQDGGLNWIGHDNITTWFRKSGLKISGWN